MVEWRPCCPETRRGLPEENVNASHTTPAVQCE
jgi:hypothetical protein